MEPSQTPATPSQPSTALTLPATLERIANEITRLHTDATVLAVGSYARTKNADAKDVDLEIYRVPKEDLNRTLEGLKAAGILSELSFGGNAYVLAFAKDFADHSLNFSLPLRQSAKPKRYDPDSVTADPNMSFEEASLRRDFTINAIGMDLKTGKVLDPHRGVQDFANRTLRPLDPHFQSDPVTLPRTIRILAETGFNSSPELNDAFKNMVLHPGDRSPSNFQADRYAYEMSTLLTSPKAPPSVVIELLHKYGVLDTDLPLLSLLVQKTSGTMQYQLASVDRVWNAYKNCGNRLLLLGNVIGALVVEHLKFVNSMPDIKRQFPQLLLLSYAHGLAKVFAESSDFELVARNAVALASSLDT